MILNAYAVLDAATSLLRLGLGLSVVFLGISLWCNWRTTLPSERRTLLEDRSYFLFLLANLLLILTMVSWPLFYLLLQSYVSQWPDVMCIYGVTQIGTGSSGLSRFLPGLLTALQALKPVLIFVSGAWFVLYLLNRRTRTAPLMSRVLFGAVLFGLLAACDASVEGAYLLIPKKDEFLSSGCCTLPPAAPSSAANSFSGILSDEKHGGFYAAIYYLTNGGMCLALVSYLCLPSRRRTLRLLPLALGALLSVPVSIVFVIAVAAPVLLHLAHHHCPYDLLPAVPESTAAFGLFVVGCFSVGWACIAGWFGKCTQTTPFLSQEIGKLLRWALWGYAGSVLMLSLELVLA
jgi:hypothetical protein